MIRNLKVLGTMVVAALAMSAMLASAAQAEGAKGTFTGGDTPNTHTASTVHGEQYGVEDGSVNYFEAFSVKVTCTNAGTTYTGTDDNGTATTMTITPHFKDCSAGGSPMTFTTNGCDFTFTQPTTVAPLGTGKYTGTGDMWCPANTRYDIEVYLFGGVTSHFGGIVCTILVGNAAGGHTNLGGHVIYTPGIKNGKDDLTVKVAMTGLPASRSGSSCSTESTSSGVFNSTITVTDKEDGGGGNPQDVWISDE